MLAIRLQRTGRSGHSQFRMIVQDSHFSPKRGRVVAYLGSYNPHTKTASLDSEKALQYLQNGAQPSDRAARLLKKEGVKLPAWVKLSEPQKRSTRNPDKRRSTRPAQPEAPAKVAVEETPQEAVAGSETPAEPVTPEEPAAESSVEEATPAEVSTEETPVEPGTASEETKEEIPADAPAETPPAEEPLAKEEN